MEKCTKNSMNISKNNKYLIPTVLMIIYILIAMIVVVIMKFAMTTEDTNVSIFNNSGEEAYYSAKYDSAVSEYTSYQEKEEWPIWNIRLSEIYSVKGDFKKSNELIQKSYDVRNKIIDTENVNKEELELKDKELANYIVFNYFMNGEYEKALEYGELFLTTYTDDIKLSKTMFAVYIANNDKTKAENIINVFSEDYSDSDKLVSAAKMNFFIGRYDNGLKLLEDAYKLNTDDVNVFDAIEDAVRYNKSNVLNAVLKLQDKDKENTLYKLFLAKIYSKDLENLAKCEEILLDLESDFSNNINYMFIKSQMYVEQDEYKKAQKILSELADENKDTFIGEYAESLDLYYDGKYDEALKHAKKTIVLNGDYTKVYSSLIPSILFSQKKAAEEEPYLREALYKEPFNYSNLITVAEYYKDVLKDSSRGLYYYELASKINPNNAETYYKMALIQYNNQRVDEAIKLIKQSISVNDNNAKYHRILGSIYLDQNKNVEGIKEIRNAYELDNNDIATLNNAAYYYVYVEHNISRAMTNIKSAYEGINKTTSSSEKDIITDNYNRIKVIYDSTKDNDSARENAVVSELKLIY